MSGLLALANAAPHPEYGYDNNFSGNKKPLTRSYSSCKVEWRTVKKLLRRKRKLFTKMSANMFLKLSAKMLRYVNTARYVSPMGCAIQAPEPETSLITN